MKAENGISIVLCTYNKLDYLRKSLPFLLNLNYTDYEVIVVNDCSTDGSKEFLDSIGTEQKIKIVHHQENKGLSIARNTGIRNAKFDIIAFTDDDCLVDKDWLVELSKGFINEKIGFVIGQTFYIEKEYKGYFPERLVSNINAKWPMGCNIAYNKKVFLDCGNFDDFYFKYNNEDSEMAIRAISKGWGFNRVLGAIVYHQAIDWSVKSLLRSARNASVFPILKKKYPEYYLVFGPPVKFGLVVNIEDYIYFLILPIFIPFLFIRYLINGKRDVIIFFTKWPVYLFLRRFFVYKEAIKNRVLMI